MHYNFLRLLKGISTHQRQIDNTVESPCLHDVFYIDYNDIFSRLFPILFLDMKPQTSFCLSPPIGLSPPPLPII